MHPTFHKALNMFRQFLIACLLPLSFFATAAQADVLYYNIAHAVNHSKYIDWAVSNGANGIEADLRFTDNGDVLKFQHGTICECQFPTGWYAWNETDICVQMMSVSPTYKPDPDLPKTETIKSGKDACLVNETARGFMNTLATKSSIALFIVDSKVGGSVAASQAARAAAGRNVIAALVKDLFGKGYKGKVIVGVDKEKFHAYIMAAAQAARSTAYANRIYFSIDENGNKEEYALSAIELLNEYAPGKVAYGNGISANFDGNYEKVFKTGVAAEKQGRVQFNYIWTLDKPNPMKTYLSLGVRGIMTNSPKTLQNALKPYLASDRVPAGRMALPEDPL
jgi:hypothetical protein